MPSRKKAQGKARKAAKAAIAAEVARKEDAKKAELTRKDEACEAQLQRLRLEDDESCIHGCDKPNHESSEFVKAYLKVVAGQVALNQEPFHAAWESTEKNYSQVWEDPDKVGKIKPLLLAMGTNCVLSGDIDLARHCASSANAFGVFVTSCNNLSRGCPDTVIAMEVGKGTELFMSDEHTLVRYLQKHIPCSCLDDKYEEVKGVKKIGFCWNPRCKLPDRKAERSSMVCCSRCRQVNYCSPECQEIHWPEHKLFCEEMRMERKAYKASKKS